VSGLPAAEPAPVDARGMAALMAIRERAEADMRTLAPLIVRRFDGVERIEPDEEDVAAHAIAADIRRLIDAIVGDRALAGRLAAVLGRRGR
jgi:hypothetical protein